MHSDLLATGARAFEKVALANLVQAFEDDPTSTQVLHLGADLPLDAGFLATLDRHGLKGVFSIEEENGKSWRVLTVTRK